MNNRRTFIRNAASGLLAGAVAARAQGTGSSDKRKRLACNSWPFRGYFDTPAMHEYRDAKLPLLTQWEFPEFLADHFGIHHVELLPQHFPDTNPDTVEKVKQGLRKANSTCCNLMGLEFRGGVYAKITDPKVIMGEAEPWIRIAQELDVPTVTVALTGQETPRADVAAANLAPFAAALHDGGKKMLFHNDDIKRESAEILVSVVQQLKGDRAGTCPDFGNFAVRSAAYALAQLKMLAPYASNICHAKDGIAERGKFYRDDFPASMKVMQDAGFRGLYSVEYEGLEPAIEGVNKLIALVEQYLS